MSFRMSESGEEKFSCSERPSHKQCSCEMLAVVLTRTEAYTAISGVRFSDLRTQCNSVTCHTDHVHKAMVVSRFLDIEIC
jgi:hypothetical protein